MCNLKKFESYDEQIKRLNAVKKIATTEHDKIYLIRYGYFTLVNGYKDIFVSNKNNRRQHTYLTNTTLEQFVHVKQFDDDLSNHLLKHLKRIEEEIRTTFMYKFDEYWLKYGLTWDVLDTKTHTNVSVAMRNQITKIKDDEDFQKSKLGYVKHYRTEYDEIPSWIMIKCIKFWLVENLIDSSPSPIKSALVDMYGIESTKKNRYNNRDFRILKGSLELMRKIRNECAHNERIYDFSRKDSRIITRFHQNLPGNKYTRGRDSKLMDLFIHMKYYLPHSEYTIFIRSTYKMLIELKSKINSEPFSRLKNKMGIHKLEDLLLLLENPHETKYPLR